MTGIETITGKIQADAQAQIDQINQQNAMDVEEIRAGYEAQAQRETAAIVTKGKHSADEHGKRLISAAQMGAKKMILAAKQEMLDQTFALALVKLTQLPEQEYVKLLAKLAVSASTTGREQMILNQTDRTRYGVKAATMANEMLEKAGKTGGITLSEQTRNIKGGLLLSDGAVEVNCAFETLVRLSRGEMTGEVSKVLFD